MVLPCLSEIQVANALLVLLIEAAPNKNDLAMGRKLMLRLFAWSYVETGLGLVFVGVLGGVYPSTIAGGHA